MNNLPLNILQNVQLYLRSYLALQQNYTAIINTANTRFSSFNHMPGNLGSSVTFDQPPRAIASNGLIADAQPAQQIVHTLTVDQAQNAAIAMNAQQIIFNMKNAPGGDYREVFGESMVAEIAARMEITGMDNFISNVRPMTQSGGTTIVSSIGNYLSGPRRFFGDGVTPFNSYQQLAQAIMLGRTVGQAGSETKVYVPDFIIPQVVQSGLNQMVLERNDETAMSWQVGSWGSPRNHMFQSNLVQTHISGMTGVLNQTLTVVSTNDPTGQAVTQITVSGATASDPQAVLAADLFRFIHTDGYADVHELTYFGHAESIAPYDLRAAANAAADVSGNVIITLSEPINWAGGINQNVGTPIVAGMRLRTNASHKGAGIVFGNSLYLAMPELPEEYPFDSVTETDPNSKASFRLSFGAELGKNNSQTILYQISGWFLVPAYSTRILIPLTQTGF